MYIYFALFSLWSFGFKLYTYGHQLDPKAAVTVDGFMPPLIGYRKIANFEVYSYPGPASYAMAAVFVVLLAAMFLAWRQYRRGAMPPTGARATAAAAPARG